MPCFCPTQLQSLSSLMPRANLSVSVVPPQMADLIGLLGLEGGQMGQFNRLDIQLNSMLPNMTGPDWMRMQLAGHMPNPGAMIPTGGPALMSLTARMASVSARFPLSNLNALMDYLKRTMASMAASLLPLSAAVRPIPATQMANIVLAAKLTLGLRKMGLCPLALAGIDPSFSESLELGDPVSTYQSILRPSVSLTAAPFALSAPKLGLAFTMAASASLADMPTALSLPPVNDPNFNAMAMNMLASLASMVPLPISPAELLADLNRLMDLMSIQEAFGMDAMTPAGITKIETMLSFMSRLRLPNVPVALLALLPELEPLPTLDMVSMGAQSVQSGASNFAASLSLAPPMPPILPLLEALNAFGAVMEPMGSCGTCKFF